MPDTTQDFEAGLLSKHTGLRKPACLAWMKANNVQHLTDLKDRWAPATFGEAMARAQTEIEDFILSR